MKYDTLLSCEDTEKILKMEGRYLSKILLGGVISENEREGCKNVSCVFLTMVYLENNQTFCLNLALQVSETTGYSTLHKYLIRFDDHPHNISPENYTLNGQPMKENVIYQIDVNSEISQTEIYRKFACNKIDSEKYESIEQDHILVFYLEDQKTIAIYPQNDMSGLMNVKIVDFYDFMV